MTTQFRVLSREDFDEAFGPNDQFGLDVLHGLSESPKQLSSKYFYDDAGSRLFERIMELSEYYPTQCEVGILDRHKAKMAESLAGAPFNLVELGAGNGRKTRILLDEFLDRKLPFRYVPIDISEAAVRQLTGVLSADLPDLAVDGIVGEYSDALKWLNSAETRRNLVLFLGSNIGNFGAADARAFLRSLWNSLNDGDLALIGFDLKKDIDVMLDAYNDSEGVTAEFNLNLLRRINRELGADFDIEKFRHYATYDVFTGAVESYLVSRTPQTVNIAAVGQSFDFLAWEPIHTEYSYKYLDSDIEQLAADTGFVIRDALYDEKRYFTDSVWEVRKLANAETSTDS